MKGILLTLVLATANGTKFVNGFKVLSRLEVITIGAISTEDICHCDPKEIILYVKVTRQKSYRSESAKTELMLSL